MSIIKEIFKDFTNDNNYEVVIDLSEYKGQKVKIFIEAMNESFDENKIKALSGSIQINNKDELENQIQMIRSEWDRDYSKPRLKGSMYNFKKVFKIT